MNDSTILQTNAYNNEYYYAKNVGRYGLSKMQPVIISCAITGAIHGAEANPNLPETKDAQVKSAVEAYKAGASLIHIHARDPEHPARMTANVNDYKELNARIREQCPDVIINNTCVGGRMLDEDNGWNVGPNSMVSLDALPEVSSVDLAAGSTYIPMKERPTELGDPHPKFLAKSNYFMSQKEAAMVVKEMTDRQIKPELELFCIHDLFYVESLIAQGLLKGPHWIQVLFGGNGIHPTPEIMLQITRLLPADSLLSVIGIGACQTAMITQAMLLGHHVRVGLEDSFYYEPGVLAESNAQMVERAVRIAKELGRPVATPAQAREIMGLDEPRNYTF